MDKTIALIVIGIILLAIISAFIFSSSFRKDVIASEGEAAVLGVINVKGVIIVLLTGIFVAAFIIILQYIPESSQSEQGITAAIALDYLQDNRSKENYIIKNNGGLASIMHSGNEYLIGKLPEDPPEDPPADRSGNQLTATKDTSDQDKWNISLGGSKLGNVRLYSQQFRINSNGEVKEPVYMFGNSYPIGNLGFYFTIDTVIGYENNNKWQYMYEIRFGEGPENNIVWNEKIVKHPKSAGGEFLLGNELKLLQHPQWKNNYYVGLWGWATWAYN